MSQASPRTYTFTAAQVAAYRVVKQSAGAATAEVATAEAGTIIGSTLRYVPTSGNGAVHLFNSGGVVELTLTATATVGDALYAAAAGYVGRTTITGARVGFSEQTGNPGDIVAVRIDYQGPTV